MQVKIIVNRISRSELHQNSVNDFLTKFEIVKIDNQVSHGYGAGGGYTTAELITIITYKTKA